MDAPPREPIELYNPNAGFLDYGPAVMRVFYCPACGLEHTWEAEAIEPRDYHEGCVSCGRMLVLRRGAARLEVAP